MSRAYIETSFVNRAEEASITGTALLNCLRGRQLLPIVGTNTIYELARTFLTPYNQNKGCRLFKIVEDLDPSYSPPNRWLLHQELIRLRTGSTVLPFLDPLNQVAARWEVSRLARGCFDTRATTFITNRQKEIQSYLPLASREYLLAIKRRNLSDLSFRQLRTFTQVCEYFEPMLPHIIGDILKGKNKQEEISATDMELKEMSCRLDSLLALRTAVRANLYWDSVHITHGASPALDKTYDYRHVIDASYCDVFFTADEQLARTVPHLNPNLTVLRLKDLSL